MNLSYKTSRPIYVGRNSHSTEDIKGRADAGGARAYKLIVPISFHKVHANQYIKINAVDRRMNGPGASVREGGKTGGPAPYAFSGATSRMIE